MMDRARKSLQVGLLLPYIQGLMDRAEATSAVHLHISRVTQGAKLANRDSYLAVPPTPPDMRVRIRRFE
jgi:hypothetical protein